MKATGFLQIVPERGPSGRARALTIANVTGRYPRKPLPGAIILKAEIDIPDALAHAQTIEAAAEAGACTIVLPESSFEPEA